MTLGEKQELFSKLEAEWVLWILNKSPNYKLRKGESRILPLGADGKSGRKTFEVGSGRLVHVRDAVHMYPGSHYDGIGSDWNLFVDGVHIEQGSNLNWIEVGEKWESMHPLARWGGRFDDANHISLEHEGRK